MTIYKSKIFNAYYIHTEDNMIIRLGDNCKIINIEFDSETYRRYYNSDILTLLNEEETKKILEKLVLNLNKMIDSINS